MRRLILLTLLSLTSLQVAQGASVKLTLVLVPERDACAGGSYLKDGSCSPIDYEDALQWAEQRPHLTTTLEPGAHGVELSAEFFEQLNLLVEYDTFPPPDLDGRWSMVLIFDAPAAAGKTFKLRRKAIDGISETLAQVAIGKLGHVLTHQRADAFKPVRAVSWVLTIDSESYRFWMKKP